ncbi:MAG: VirB3 family type IV secretion system protein [Thermoanaerobaculia bacterium]|nr:VirB3 family type IV secretion system protein [Thermoanaerobaculia bacterium]
MATKLYPSLVRPVLVSGIERELVILLVAIVLALVFAFRPNLTTPTLAAGIVLVGFPRLRRWNRTDPQAFAVFRRHVQRAGTYLARARFGDLRPNAPRTF